jgi:hypothetical protein
MVAGGAARAGIPDNIKSDIRITVSRFFMVLASVV